MQNNSAKAILRKVRVSPQKLNIVASMIRGMNAQKALNVLMFSKKRIANDVRKTLLSAIANAENNNGLNSDALFVKEAHVGYSIKLRRFHPRGRGRGGVVTKPFSHLTIVVEERI
ncbi:MAG: 50S ribosomal protein L22 [Alphaproteobacteria bacterium]|nr:50S ribosomal protein L22 [Alphaproteobacteria bacterium]